jgi:hypothetical protein
MDEYKQDIFYDFESLPLDKRLSLIIDAKELSYNWWADHIVGAQRQLIPDTDFQEQLEKFDETSVWRFVHRRGYDYKDYRLEIVLNEMGNFLWIQVEENEIPWFVKKYKLERK